MLYHLQMCANKHVRVEGSRLSLGTGLRTIACLLIYSTISPELVVSLGLN